MLHRILLIHLLATLLLCLWGCSPQPHPSGITKSPEEQLTHSLNLILSDPILSQCTVGMSVVRLSDNRVLFSKNETKLLHPASTMKLFTTALALEHLGGTYHFSTQLAALGEIKPRIQELYFIGAGDPSLTTEDITTLARQLKQQSIEEVGSIICDATIFDDVQYGHGWMWDDQPYKDFAPISGLSINKNIIELHLTPAATRGEPVKIRTLPDTSFIATKNTATTVNGNNNLLQITRDIQNNINTLTITGTLGLQSEEQIILRNLESPALYAGTLLQEECQRIGIKIKNKPRLGTTPEQYNTIALHKSRPLASLITDMNKESHNIYAELLLKTVANKNQKQQGSAEQGLELLNTLMDQWNITETDYAFADGSGVSRYNLVTPQALTALLSRIYNDDTKRNDFINSLPIGGFDGDLDWRMENLSTKQNVKAKTGYLRGVSALAGFIETDSGETLAFSIIMEHFNGPTLPFIKAQDRLCNTLSLF